MSCPACERSRHEGKQYCIECGAPLAEEDQTPFFERKLKRKGVPPAPQASFRASETTASGKHKRKYRGTRRKAATARLLGVLAALLLLAVLIVLLVSVLGGRHKTAPAPSPAPSEAPAAVQAGGDAALLEQADYRVVYCGTQTCDGQYRLQFRLENLSDDDLRFELAASEIDARVFSGSEPGVDETVAAGAAAEADLCLRSAELAMVGAEQPQQVRVELRVTNADGETDHRAAELYPADADAETFERPEPVRFERAQTLLETPEQICVLGQPTVSAAGDLLLAVYWRNEADAVQRLKLEQVRGDGGQLPGQSVTLQPGTEGYQILVFAADDLQAAGTTAQELTALAFRASLTAEGANDLTAEQDVTCTLQ